MSKALTQWEKSNISYENYLNFIDNKKDKFKLTFIDLLYVKNFKGGFATTNEPEKEILEKLKEHTKIFKQIDEKFKNKKLANLNTDEINSLIKFSKELLEFAISNNKYKIDGFGVSFLTTLLHFHFPKLYPILDRRVLNGLNLIDKKKDVYADGQVKNIKNFYPELIREFKEKIGNKTIRELDKILFIKKID